MGYHATLPKFASSNSSENEVIPSEHHQQQHQTDQVTPLPGKYYLATGREFPFCRKCEKTIGCSCPQVYESMNETFPCRTPLSIHHWAGETKTSRTLGAGLYDGIDLFGSRCTAWHRSHQRYRSTRTRHQISNCHSEPTRSGRQYSQSRIELVARNECAGAPIAVLVLVQRPPLRKIHSRWNDANAIKRVSTLTTIPPCVRLLFNGYSLNRIHRKRNTEFSHRLCAPKREYADIANRGSSIFYDNCKSWMNETQNHHNGCI